MGVKKCARLLERRHITGRIAMASAHAFVSRAHSLAHSHSNSNSNSHAHARCDAPGAFARRRSYVVARARIDSKDAWWEKPCPENMVECANVAGFLSALVRSNANANANSHEKKRMRSR